MRNVPSAKNPYYANSFAFVKWTVGAKSGTTITVTGQLLTNRGGNPAGVQKVMVWLSDNASGSGVCAVAPDGAVAIATAGVILVSPTAKLIHHVNTDVNGKFDINITNSAAKNLYVVVAMPDGSVSVSPVVAF